MILEMDNSELMLLVESNDALNAKVQEALSVLNEYASKEVWLTFLLSLFNVADLLTSSALWCWSAHTFRVVPCCYCCWCLFHEFIISIVVVVYPLYLKRQEQGISTDKKYLLWFRECYTITVATKEGDIGQRTMRRKHDKRAKLQKQLRGYNKDQYESCE